MDALRLILMALLPMAVIFLIIFNIIKTTNRVKKGFILLMIGIAFLCVMAYAYFIDAGWGMEYISNPFYYLPVGSLSLALIGYGTYLLIKGKKVGGHLSSKKGIYINDTTQYLYMVFKHEGMYYLLKKDEEYEGCVVKFTNGINFYDDMQEKYFEEKGIKALSNTLVGTATVFNKKHKTIFSCFMVEVENIDVLDGYEKTDPFGIATLPMKDFHKQLIMKTLIGTNFNIEIKKDN